MTTLNTIIEEEKTKARNKFEDEFVDVREEELGSTWKKYSNPDLIPEMLSEILTTAIQRAYEAGRAEESEKRNAVVKEYKEEGVMFILKVEDGKTYEASMPIPKWAEVGEIALRDTLLSKIRS